MTTRVTIKLNNDEIGRLLRGEGQYSGVKTDLLERAERIAAEAGDGNAVEEGGSRARARYVVVTETEDAMLAEARDRNLTRAFDAGRG